MTEPASSDSSASPSPSSAPEKRKNTTQPLIPVRGTDREFLPAALEILETPPSPVPTVLAWVICIFTSLALIWAYFGRLEVYATAPGKIDIAGRSKIIQPLEAGKVLAIDVENGKRVHAGDLLISLDPTEMEADKQSATKTLYAQEAEIAGRGYTISLVQPLQIALSDFAARDQIDSEIYRPLTEFLDTSSPPIDWQTDLPAEVRQREINVTKADVGQLLSVLLNLQKQIDQKHATHQRLTMSIEFQEKLASTLNELVNTRQQAIDMQVGTKINLFDAKAELHRSLSSMASDKGQLIETDASIKELQSEQTRSVAQFVADNRGKAEDAFRKADDARQSLNKAVARLDHTRLFAPLDGTVQQLAVTTIGQVVTTGQQLLVLTPSDGALQAEALISNLDIGFVKIGQDVVIKIDAFPFTRYNVIHGRVVKIAAEAVNEQEAKRSWSNAISSTNAAANAPTGAPGQPDSFVFPITIELEQKSIDIEGKAVALEPGMTLVAEVKTDNRRVIDYILSPISKVAAEALHER